MSTTDVYTASGTWTCPAYVTTVWVRAWGGGGTGGGVTVTPSTTLAGGGAAGGAFAERLAIPVTPGTVYNVVVAATLVAFPAIPGHGSAGNDSYFIGNGVAVYANGGAGGAAPTADGATAAGGVGTTFGSLGDNVYAGGNGSDGASNDTSTFVGSGGGGAGSGGAGSNGSGSTGGAGGTGNGGAGGNGRTGTAGDGNAGNTYGGGGAGAMGTAAAHTWVGGNGAAGRVELEYTPTYTSGGGIRAVSDTPVDVTSAPGVIDTLVPAGSDVFLLVNNGTDSGLWEWVSAGAAMNPVADPDGVYRDVREGTHAGARVFVASGVFAGSASPFIVPNAPAPVVPTGNSYFVNPDVPNWVVKAKPGPEGYVGVLPSISGGGSAVVTHNLGTRFLLVAVAATAAPYAFVKLGGSDWVVERTDLNTVTVRPPSAITIGDYEILIRKAV